MEVFSSSEWTWSPNVLTQQEENRCELVTLSFAPTGQFLIKNVVPQESGESAKVKVKVRVNVHGVFSVSSASLIEVVKTAEGEEPMETDQTAKEEEVCVCSRWYQTIYMWQKKEMEHCTDALLDLCICFAL